MDAKFFGAEQELFRAVGVHLPDRQDQLDWLHRQDVLPDVSGDHYAYDISEEEPTARIEYRTTLRNRLRKLGKRRFLTINPYPYRNTPDRIEDRHLPVETTRARTFVDTIHLELPASWKIESGAATDPLVIEHPAGSYRAEISPTKEGGYRYVRTFSLRPVRLPASGYDGLRRFYTEVSKAERAQLVLKERQTK
jgi:hypothetical protein